MLRDRFQWEVVPQPLLRRLVRDLELRGSPTQALAERYGRRPRPTFVRDNWGVLRDVWLPDDTFSRCRVVAGLRGRGLGDTGAPADTRAQQLCYLLSCRNSPALREVVLAAFHDLGEAEPAPAEGRRVGPDAFECAVEDAWVAFVTELDAALRDLAAGVLTVELPPTTVPSGEPVRPSFTFCRSSEGAGLDATLTFAADLLGPGGPLEAAELELLGELGWRLGLAPGRTALHGRLDGCPGGPRAAAAAVVTMREVFGVIHPSFLATPNLRPRAAGLAGEHLVADPQAVEPLVALVQAALAPRLEGPPRRDEDGDIHVELGTGTGYVRVGPDGPYVSVFAPLLRDVPGDALVLERLNQLNQAYRGVRFTWAGGVVTATTDLWCRPFVPALVLQSVDAMAAVVGQVRDIRHHVGGQFYGPLDDD